MAKSVEDRNLGKLNLDVSIYKFLQPNPADNSFNNHRIREQAMLRDMLILVFCLIGSTMAAKYKTIDCLSIVYVTLQQSAPMIASNQYTFDVAWPSTITDIKDTGLAWAGYRLLRSTNAMLSFDAELVNLTSNGATIKINYKDKGQLYLLQFAVLITRTCSENKFQLTTQALPIKVLSKANRAANEDFQTFDLVSDVFDLSNGSDFYVRINLKDFTVWSTTGTLQSLFIEKVAIIDKKVQIVLKSYAVDGNVYEAVTVVMLIIKKSAFSPPFLYYSSYYDIDCQNCTRNYPRANLNTSNSSVENFPTNQVALDQCIVAEKGFKDGYLNFDEKLSFIKFIGTHINFTSISHTWSMYNISCFISCGEGYFFQSATHSCNKCFPQCTTCSNATSCLICQKGWFAASDGKCIACPAQCSACQSNSSCSECVADHALIGTSCVPCLEAKGFFLQKDNQCLRCDEGCSSCEKEATNCLVCSKGYSLSVETKQCLPAPSAVIDCLYINHVTLQDTELMVYPNTYTFPILWSKPIPDIKDVILGLRGFEVQPAYHYLSFQVNITNITETGVTILVSPTHNESTISFLQYEVIAVSGCANGKIYLFSQKFVPAYLKPYLGVESQKAVIDVSRAEIDNFGDCLAYAYFSDFNVRVNLEVGKDQRQRLGYENIDFQDGKILVSVQSPVEYSNNITSVTIAILLIKTNKFQQPFYHFSLTDINSSSPSCEALSSCTKQQFITSSGITPSQIPLQQSIITAKNFRSSRSDHDRKSIAVSWLDNVLKFDSVNINWNLYIVSTVLTCKNGYYYEGNFRAGVCKRCPEACPNCFNSTNCCFSGQIFVDGKCKDCNIGEYSVSNGTKCLVCMTGCAQCQNADICSLCKGGYQKVGNICQPETAKLEQSGSSAAGIVIAVVLSVLFIIFLIFFCLSGKGAECRTHISQCCQPGPGAEAAGVGVAGDAVSSRILVIPSNLVEPVIRGENCAVCLVGDNDAQTVCHHKFHIKCLKRWWNTNHNCPICNHPNIDPVQLSCKVCHAIKEVRPIARLSGNQDPQCMCGMHNYEG